MVQEVVGSSPITHPICIYKEQNLLIYNFLQEDCEDLKKSVEAIEAKLKEIKAEVGTSTSQSSETWHDNSWHEELMRLHNLHSASLGDRKKILLQARVVPAESRKNYVGLGSKVTYTDDQDNKYTITIGSYLVLSEKPGYVSYASPIGALFFGKKVGDAVTGTIAKQERRYTITAVENA